VSVGTRIVTRRGPTAQRHELSAGNPCRRTTCSFLACVFHWMRNPRKSNASLMCTIRVLASDNRRPNGASTFAISSYRSATSSRYRARARRNRLLMPTGGLCRPRRERAGRRGGDGWLVGIIRAL
jgi:hypothetical protein